MADETTDVDASEEVENEELESNEDATEGDAEEASADAASADAADGDVSENESEDVSDPEFSELNPTNVEASAADLNRLNDVKVVVSAELGRTKVAIEELLKLNVGSIFELNRSIDSPVELIAQGVPLGNGEVVVVDGSFAIRIQEIYAPQ